MTKNIHPHLLTFKEMLYYTNTSKFEQDSSAKSNRFSASIYPKSVQTFAHALPLLSKMNKIILSLAAAVQKSLILEENDNMWSLKTNVL